MQPLVDCQAPKTFGPRDHWPPTQTIGPPGEDYWPLSPKARALLL